MGAKKKKKTVQTTEIWKEKHFFFLRLVLDTETVFWSTYAIWR